MGFDGLSRLNAVKIRSSHPLTTQIYETDESLMIHLTITGRCYARCKSYVNSAITMGSDRPRNAIVSSKEVEPERDTAIIRQLADRHRDQSITICFYGGEPFLAAGKMERTRRIQ